MKSHHLCHSHFHRRRHRHRIHLRRHGDHHHENHHGHHSGISHIHGPGNGLGHNSVIYMIEWQVNQFVIVNHHDDHHIVIIKLISNHRDHRLYHYHAQTEQLLQSQKMKTYPFWIWKINENLLKYWGSLCTVRKIETIIQVCSLEWYASAAAQQMVVMSLQSCTGIAHNW